MYFIVHVCSCVCTCKCVCVCVRVCVCILPSPRGSRKTSLERWHFSWKWHLLCAWHCSWPWRYIHTSKWNKVTALTFAFLNHLWGCSARKGLEWFRGLLPSSSSDKSWFEPKRHWLFLKCEWQGKLRKNVPWEGEVEEEEGEPRPDGRLWALGGRQQGPRLRRGQERLNLRKFLR